MSEQEVRIDRAAELQEASKAALYREDGARLFGDEEHEEREQAIDQEFNAAMDAVEADADQRIASAGETLFVAENADPTALLSTEELSQANARRPVITDEVYTMELDRLADRCRAVLKQGDRPTMFTYALAAAQRVGERSSAGAAYLENRYGDGGSGAPRAATDEPGAEGVREVVAELKSALDPAGAEKIASTRKAIEEARALKNHAYYRRRGARNAGELHVNQTYGRSRTG